MALIPQSAFTPDTAAGVSAGPASAAFALPGTLAGDTVVRVTNVGTMAVYCKLGNSAVAVTNSTGLCVMPGDTVYLGIGANTHIAMTTGTQGTSSTINLTTGN